MSHYPLMFTFRDAVSGDGFLAGVTLSGRALMVKEGENEWCVYGVRPAAIAETGTTPQEAYLRFRNRYKDVLFDISGESKNFEDFRRETERFYYEPDAQEEQRWEEAFQNLRCGKVVPQEAFVCALPKENPENRTKATNRSDGRPSRWSRFRHERGYAHGIAYASFPNCVAVQIARACRTIPHVPEKLWLGVNTAKITKLLRPHAAGPRARPPEGALVPRKANQSGTRAHRPLDGDLRNRNLRDRSRSR